MDAKDRYFEVILQRIRKVSPQGWRRILFAPERPELFATLGTFTLHFFPYKEDIDLVIREGTSILFDYSELRYQPALRKTYFQLIDQLKEHDSKMLARLDALLQ